nr:phosphatidylinositol 45 bisphosphate [Hymenolepis microstoma]
MGFISVYCCTWNVGDEPPPEKSLDKLLGVDANPHPDIVFLGLQEVVRSDEWYEAIRLVMAPLDYVLIKQRNCWAIWIYAFVKRYLLPDINNIESELSAFGYAGIMGNKGACSIRFEICGVNMASVSAHFTPHTENLDDRINDYRDVLKGQTFRDPDVNTLMDHDYVFWMGDLNFRTEGLKKDQVERLIASKNIKKLLEYDQLRKAMESQLAFLDFKEGEITFPPTFKFDKGTKNYDSSKKQRVPSYTDRILYMAHNDFALEHNVKLDENGRKMPQAMRKTPSRGGPSVSNCGAGCETTEDSPELKLLAYNYLPEYVCSDHRPVFAKFEARVPCSWFKLPVKFIQPSMPVHPVNDDLSFLYVALDPPPLNTGGLACTRRRSRQQQQHFCSIRASSNDGLVRHFSTIDRTRSKKKGATTDSQDDVSVGKEELQPVQSNLLSPTSRRLSVSCEGLEKLHPPAALQVRGKDWVSVYPAGFYNIWKDGLASVFCSTSSLSTKDGVLDKFVEGSMKRSEKMDIVLNRIPPSDIHDKYNLLKGKVDSSVLQRCRSEAIQLVYFSKYKNCPQGYSDMIKISRTKSKKLRFKTTPSSPN